MSLVANPVCAGRSVTGPHKLRGSRASNPIRVAAPSSRRRVPGSRPTSAPCQATLSPDQVVAAITTHPMVFELAGNANELVDGCGVNGTCGQVAAPPFALIGASILIGGGVLVGVTFGLKVRLSVARTPSIFLITKVTRTRP